MEAKHRGRTIDLHMERRPMPYVAQKPKPFGSQGQRLGSIVPQIVSDSGQGSSSSSAAAVPPPNVEKTG